MLFYDEALFPQEFNDLQCSLMMGHSLHRTLMMRHLFAQDFNNLWLFAQDFNDLQLFAQDIPDEVFDLYCWIHSTYTIPRALRFVKHTFCRQLFSFFGRGEKEKDKCPTFVLLIFEEKDIFPHPTFLLLSWPSSSFLVLYLSLFLVLSCSFSFFIIMSHSFLSFLLFLFLLILSVFSCVSPSFSFFDFLQLFLFLIFVAQSAFNMQNCTIDYVL